MTIETVEKTIKILYGKYPGLENTSYNFFLSRYFEEYYNIIIPVYTFSSLMSIETITRVRRKVHEKMRLKGWIDKKSLEKEEQKQKILDYAGVRFYAKS